MNKPLIILLMLSPLARAGVNVERLADAIYKAEGGAKASHEYGILAHYKHTTPRQACINTINNQIKRHEKHKCGKDFLVCLRDRYAPLKASNDPKNLNANWLKNVKYFYEKNKKK
jgi:hypothetical protein